MYNNGYNNYGGQYNPNAMNNLQNTINQIQSEYDAKMAQVRAAYQQLQPMAQQAQQFAQDPMAVLNGSGQVQQPLPPQPQYDSQIMAEFENDPKVIARKAALVINFLLADPNFSKSLWNSEVGREELVLLKRDYRDYEAKRLREKQAETHAVAPNGAVGTNTQPLPQKPCPAVVDNNQGGNL
ncbi:MAG: hypothetical protein FWD76_01880 [Firmicutes bacterium]|nr:hypothetical protein [Bacillota bacterium]